MNVLFWKRKHHFLSCDYCSTYNYKGKRENRGFTAMRLEKKKKYKNHFCPGFFSSEMLVCVRAKKRRDETVVLPLAVVVVLPLAKGFLLKNLLLQQYFDVLRFFFLLLLFCLRMENGIRSIIWDVRKLTCFSTSFTIHTTAIAYGMNNKLQKPYHVQREKISIHTETWQVSEISVCIT